MTGIAPAPRPTPETGRPHVTTLIYLDIDGVLLPLGGIPLDQEGNLLGSNEPIAALNTLTDRLDASLVISSTWRFGRSLEALARLLQRWGVAAEVVGATPDLGSGPAHLIRAREITADIESRRPTRVVVIDDLPIRAAPGWTVIRTAPYSGLTAGDVEDVLRQLA